MWEKQHIQAGKLKVTSREETCELGAEYLRKEKIINSKKNGRKKRASLRC